jgi:hypothetical protein
MLLPESSPMGVELSAKYDKLQLCVKLTAKHDDACCTVGRLIAVQLALNIPT